MENADVGTVCSVQDQSEPATAACGMFERFEAEWTGRENESLDRKAGEPKQRSGNFGDEFVGRAAVECHHILSEVLFCLIFLFEASLERVVLLVFSTSPARKLIRPGSFCSDADGRAGS